MRVYILTDLEGVSGVDRWDPHRYDDPEARRWKEEAVALLTGEVKAAVDGALDAGTTEILIRDGHGHGDDLPREGWAPEVELIQGSGRTATPEERASVACGWLPRLDDTVDALLFVGQHAREGAAGAVLPHSWSRPNPRRCWLGGTEVGETGAAAFLAAELGVSTAFLSGDRAAVEEVRGLAPGVVTVEVKHRRADGTVAHEPPEKIREAIRTGVKDALASLPPPLEALPSPHTFREVFLRPPLAGLPFLAGRLGGRLAARALLTRIHRWPTDPSVTTRIADRRTLEYRGPTVASVLNAALG